MDEKKVLHAQIHSFHYPSHKGQEILSQVDFSLKSQQIIGLVAPNGTGKSTLIDILAGHLQAPTVQVTYQGITPQKNAIQWKRSVNKMLNPLELTESLSGKTHLELYTSIFKRSKQDLAIIIEEFQLASFMNRKVATYSLGMRQRLCFALTVLSDASILLLDEVMNGLDPTGVGVVTEYLQRLVSEGKTILLASHLLENLDQFADEIYFLKDTHIIHTLLSTNQSSHVLQITTKYQPNALLIEELCLDHLKYDISQSTITIPLAYVTKEQQQQLLTRVLSVSQQIQSVYLGRETIRLLYDKLYLTEV